MEVVLRAAVVRQEQQPECDLSDDQGLRERDELRNSAPGPPSPGGERSHCGGDADRDDEERIDVVDGQHRRTET
jgi:hypothetical protein